MPKPLYTRGGFAYPGTSLQFKTGTWRVQKPVHNPVIAPCHSICPAGENPQAYIALMDEGHIREAWETLVSVNPIPAITGRVCHHPCENACNRGEYDDPLAIHSIERYLGDQALKENWHYPVTTPSPSAARIAVVGAGPAGLSAAYHLIRQGYNVTLFSALSEAGGTLHAIPGYRLPRHIITEEVESLLTIGIDYRPSQRLGRDMHLNELQDEYSAVFLAMGTQSSREWSVAGVIPRDLHVGLNLLKEWMAVGSVPDANSVAIVGGGNTAVDLARILRRNGIPDVHIITHKSLPGPNVTPQDSMPAIAREVEQALEEGVIIHEHRGIHRLILRGERVVGVEMVHMKKMQDAQGNMKRVAFEGTETVLHVDQVIPAIGQVVTPTGIESLLHGESYLQVDANGHITGHVGLFAGGDACSNSSNSVTAAVGDGRRAANAIVNFLKGIPQQDPSTTTMLGYSQLNLNYFEPAPRNNPAILPLEQRVCEEEIESGLSSSQVHSEVRRCFSCGSCMACDNCWVLCPDSAVLKTTETASDGSHYIFDYDYCKGCGLCANECPCGYITMTEDL